MSHPRQVPCFGVPWGKNPPSAAASPPEQSPGAMAGAAQPGESLSQQNPNPAAHSTRKEPHDFSALGWGSPCV